MSWEVYPWTEAIVGAAGLASAVALFLAPLPTFRKILEKQNTQDFSCIPYAAGCLNCICWVIYTAPTVTPNRTAPLVTNAVGIVFETTYFLTFIYFARDAVQKTAVTLLLAILNYVGIFVFILFAAVPASSRSDVAGIASMVFTVLMFAAPLAAMRNALRSGSVEFVPLPLSIMTFLCSSIWTIYGLYVRDLYIIIPNDIGMLLSVFQLCIYGAITSPSAQERYDRLRPASHVDDDISSEITMTELQSGVRTLT